MVTSSKNPGLYIEEKGIPWVDRVRLSVQPTFREGKGSNFVSHLSS